MIKKDAHWDRLIAVTLALLVLIGAVMCCDTYHGWGDDFAAYILQGKAIVEGNIQQQTQLNVQLHPSRAFSFDTQTIPQLVYVWGFPLQLALIYQFVGFHFLSSQNILYYKLPACLAISILCAILFLFFRRRFRRDVSMLLSVSIVLSIFPEVNQIGTDLPFLCATYCTFYLYETLWDRESKRGMLIHACLLGISMWYTYILRLNGFTVVGLVAAMHVFTMATKPEYRNRIRYHIFAYVVFGLLLAVFYLLFPYPTSNLGDVGIGNIAEGLRWNLEILEAWIGASNPINNDPLRTLFLRGLEACFVLGVLGKGIQKEFGYVVFLVGSLLITASLPYSQGLRYLYGILPLVILFAAYGIQLIINLICKSLRQERLIRGFTCLVAVCVVLFTARLLKTQLRTIQQNLQQREACSQDATENAFSESYLEMYQFVLEETEPDAVIAYAKSRLLYLVTGRKSFNPVVNGHCLFDADYYIWMKYWDSVSLTPEEENRLHLVFSNADFKVYQLAK